MSEIAGTNAVTSEGAAGHPSWPGGSAEDDAKEVLVRDEVVKLEEDVAGCVP